MSSVSGGLSLCRQTQTKAADERAREREGEGAHKAGFLLPRTPLSPREHTFNYRRDKEDMREFKYDESVIPPPQVEIALSPHSML